MSPTAAEPGILASSNAGRDALANQAREHLVPNLFVIGASKSGTSALHAYLRPHPEICMSREKEPCFFVDQQELEQAWPIMARQPSSHDWGAYLDLWQGGENAKYRGEGSVYYSQAPHRSNVPARIAAKCPDARIIYSVREPVARAIGHYWQRFKEFQEKLPIERALRENAIYRDTSDYALQLNAYLEHFDRSQIHIIVAEELRSHRLDVLSGTMRWLDLPEYEFSESELAERHRSPPTNRKERFPLVKTIRDSAMWGMARKKISTTMIDRLRAVSTTKFNKADVDDTAARAYLAEYLAPKRAEFEQLLGRKVESWR